MRVRHIAGLPPNERISFKYLARLIVIHHVFDYSSLEMGTRKLETFKNDHERIDEQIKSSERSSSDSFTVDMESLEACCNEREVNNWNSRITMHRSLSRKGSQRGDHQQERMTSNSHDLRDTALASSGVVGGGSPKGYACALNFMICVLVILGHVFMDVPFFLQHNLKLLTIWEYCNYLCANVLSVAWKLSFEATLRHVNNLASSMASVTISPSANVREEDNMYKSS
ncbi:hypothetical protein Syun_027039 [Stephania yunnanensis]|uniref:Uncharacterized protein n=1 Tax=Stephania yunnanensis TaxID=152371 RepID=A0AAP0HKP0_9MAGN